MSSRKSYILNILFVIQLAVVGLVITGVLPRSAVPFLVALLAIYVLSAELEDGVIFFARSIPFFVAIPITTDFDSLNIWRILSGLIFLKWLLRKDTLDPIFKEVALLIKKPIIFFKEHRIFSLTLLLLILAVASAAQADSFMLAAKRTIYFINLSLIGIVAYDLLKKSDNFTQRLIKNISIPVIIVALVGMAQLASTYFMDIFQFVDFWAGKVELGLFGSAWANIALKANTWFAYYGSQLSLRMFSLFPDSHSFPIFLLLGLPAVLAVSLHKLVGAQNSLKTIFFARASLLIAFVPIIFLAAILSGTRGIWVAGLGVLVVVLGIFWIMKKQGAGERQKDIFKYVASYLAIFFLLFGVAYYIFASNQFQVSKGDAAIFGRRVRSVLDISETSNARRIEIWRDSIKSTIKHPLLGVGIGNFPVVVGEDLARAKAGSSAHNLYLNIAAEMGILALILALWFLWLLLKKTFDNFLENRNSKLETIYFASALIFIPWVLIYSLTDVAIFDERAFLLFAITCAVIFGQNKTD
ncbi:MAG: O-antigen ligase family protein [Patescibacteria group bacterium]